MTTVSSSACVGSAGRQRKTLGWAPPEAARENGFRSAATYTAQMDRLWTPWRYAYITGKESAGPEEGGKARPPHKGVPAVLSAWLDQHPGGLGCVFCNMLAAIEFGVGNGMSQAEADRSAYILFRGEHNFLVLNAFPYNSGHLMIVPYEHQPSLAALPEVAALEIMVLARRVETALRAVYTPDGLNLGLNLGEAAGAGVAHHLHLHAVPRWSGDTNFMSVLGETRILPEMLDDTWNRVNTALQAL